MRTLALILALATAASAGDSSKEVIDARFSTSASGPRATLRISKSHGLWNFTCALVKREPGNQQALAAIFDKSEFNTPHLTDRLKSQDFEAICKDPNFSFLWVNVATESAKAQGLSDFYARLPQALVLSANDPKMAAQNAKDFQRFLGELAPVYDQLVWRPSLDKLQSVTRRLLELAKKTDFSALYSRAEAFYRTSYDGPLLIAVAPVPNGSGGSFPIIKDVFLFEIVLDENSLDPKELAGNYGVIFHEMCHVLYDHKTADVAGMIEGVVGKQPGADGIFNEALAMTMGDWAERQVTGQERDWDGTCSYDRRTCAYAKALYPEIIAYLGAKRPMDGEFFAFARQSYLALPSAEKAAPQRQAGWEKAALAAAVADIKAMPRADADAAQSLAFNVLREMARIIRWQEEAPEAPRRDPHEWPGSRVIAEGNFNGCVEAAKAFKTLYDAVDPRHPSRYVISTLKGEDGGHAVVEVSPRHGQPFIIDTSAFESLVRHLDEQAAQTAQGCTIQTGIEDLNIRQTPGGFHVARYQYRHLFQEDRRIEPSYEFTTAGAVNDWLKANAATLHSFSDIAKTEIVVHEESGKFRGPGGKDYFIVLKTAQEPFSGTDQERVKSGQRALEDKVKNGR